MKNIFISFVIYLITVSYGCGGLRTGYYKIENVRGSTVNFVGVDGDWHVPVDTLKAGDRIYIRRTFIRDSATIW